MKLSKAAIAGVAIVVVTVITFAFQNCAKARWFDPDPSHTAFSLGLCQHCGDETGRGAYCRQTLQAAFASCQFESCNPGYLLENQQCIPVVCEPNTIASCEMSNGEGRMTCNENSKGYGPCTPIACNEGFEIKGNKCEPIPICAAGEPHDCSTIAQFGTQTCNEDRLSYSKCVYGECRPGHSLIDGVCTAINCPPGNEAECPIDHGSGKQVCAADGQAYGECVATACDPGYNLEGGVCVKPAPVCRPGTHRFCDDESRYGVETCNRSGSGYDECEYFKCKPGYHDSVHDQDAKVSELRCTENQCFPLLEFAPCRAGAGIGVKFCDRYGAGFGVCILLACQPGYTLRDGVCVHQICAPNSEAYCEFPHGIGSKRCKSSGLDYGSCELEECHPGYVELDGRCIERVCAPRSKVACRVEGGKGFKECFKNGMGYDDCEPTECDDGYKLKNGQCVDEDKCDNGEKKRCGVTNGSGHRYCDKKTKRFGPCIAEDCDKGYDLSGSGDNKACKKRK